MDDVAPLRQLAASVTKPSRQRSTDSANGQVGQVGQVGDVVLASQDPQHVSGLESRPRAKAPRAPVRAAIKPFDGSNVFLFTPSSAYRVRYVPMTGRPDAPEYPPAGARIDYYLAAPSGEVTLDILDAAGTVVRSYSSATSGAPTGGRSGGRRGSGLPSALPTKIGINRFVWDLRYPGGPAAGGGDMEGGGFGGNGPLVAPGAFKARLSAGGVTRTESFTVKIDPRVAKDGVTVADLTEQTKLALKVRDGLAEARQLAQRMRQAIDQKRGDAARLQTVLERLNTKSGPYEDQMFIDQLSNVGREIGQADQKVGASAYERFSDLMKEWAAIKTEGEAALR
jgi:hypothetical protein